MDYAITSIEVEPEHIVEIVVHINETLEDSQRQSFITALQNDDRVYPVNFCPTRCHLMLVKYDRDRYSSQDVLACVESQRVNAKLVGPV
jgi:hypothetical protein